MPAPNQPLLVLKLTLAEKLDWLLVLRKEEQTLRAAGAVDNLRRTREIIHEIRDLISKDEWKQFLELAYRDDQRAKLEAWSNPQKVKSTLPAPAFG